MTQLANALETALINHTLRATAYTPPASVFLAMFDTTASLANLEAGTLTGEVAVGSYARQAVAFGAAASRQIQNSGTISFPTLTANYPDPVRFVAFMDAVSGGNVMAYAQLASDLTWVTGNVPQFLAASLTIQFAGSNGVSDYLANKLLDFAFRNQAFSAPTPRLALFGTGASLANLRAGTLTGEVSGNGYARQPITFGAPTDGVVANNGNVVFPAANPAGHGIVRYAALMDALSAGNVLFCAQNAADVTVNLNNQYQASTGQVTASLA